jgi:hypothetical protein
MITWTHIELVFEYLWWMGLESHWFHQHLGKKTHLPDVGEPKTKLKLQGWCVKTKSFSYVSDPNMQCFKTKWNHLMSCFDPHSHVPTKLFYVYDIFVWPCNLSLVGSICGPQCLWHVCSITKHTKNGFQVMLTTCEWPINSCMGLMKNCDLSHIKSCVYMFDWEWH